MLKTWLKRLAIACSLLLGIFLLACIVLVCAGLRDDLGKADIGLVLGNKVERDGTPSPRLRARLEKTLKLYQAGYFPRVIVSGGVGQEGFDEAWIMRDYLAARGVPPERIIVDSAGVTTFESGRFARQLAAREQIRSVFAVSQYFHLPRTRLCFRKFGIAEVRSASPRFFEARDLYSIPREVVGYIQYAVRSFPSGTQP